MKSIRPLLIGLIALAAMSGPVLGQDADKKKKGLARPPAIAQVIKKVDAVGLTAEQKTKINVLADEYTPKFAEFNTKMTATLTKEQRKAKKEAQAKIKADGLKAKEAAAAIAAAIALTDDQKKVEQEVKDGQKKLGEEFNTAVLAMLTPEQKEKLPSKKKAK